MIELEEGTAENKIKVSDLCHKHEGLWKAINGRWYIYVNCDGGKYFIDPRYNRLEPAGGVLQDMCIPSDDKIVLS